MLETAMALKEKKKQKAPRKCIFCNNNASSGGEHLWPEWAHPHLNKGEYKAIFKAEGLDLANPEKSSLDNRQGGIVTKKFRCVCTDCNNGWMSQLETAVKEFLVPVMTGQKCNLTPAQLQTLIEWTTLKILIAENDRPETSTTIRPEREAFKADKTIPPRLRIWIGYMPIRKPWPRGLLYMAVQLRKKGTEADGGRPNLYCMTIAIGQLVIFAVNTSLTKLDLHDMWAEKIKGLELLHPRYSRRPRQQPWPFEYGLSGVFVESLTTGFVEFAQELIKTADDSLLAE